jgi:hypothetical protein
MFSNMCSINIAHVSFIPLNNTDIHIIINIKTEAKEMDPNQSAHGGLTYYHALSHETSGSVKI